jgi:hypothetical protein
MPFWFVASCTFVNARIALVLPLLVHNTLPCTKCCDCAFVVHISALRPFLAFTEAMLVLQDAEQKLQALISQGLRQLRQRDADDGSPEVARPEFESMLACVGMLSAPARVAA